MKLLKLSTILSVFFISILSYAQVPKISLNGPANNATEVVMNPMCIWQSVSSATSYWFEISTSTAVDAATGEFTTKTRNHKFDMKTNNYWQIRAGLQPNTKYYWHVLTKIGTELGAWSDMWNFTTSTVIDKPYQVSPDEDATMVDQPISMTFYKVPKATKYALQITNVATKTIIVYNQNVLDNNGDPQYVNYTVTNLSALTQYTWRVRCYVNGQWGTWTDSIAFTTGETLAAPVLTSPVNGAVDQLVNPILTYVVANGQTYRVDVSTNKNFLTDVGTFTNSCGNLHLYNLNNLTKYYWRARPESDLSTGAYSEVWSFTTVAGATTYLPDLSIKAIGYGTSAVGESLYDLTNAGTYFAVLEANSLKKAIFYITVKNAGKTADFDLFVTTFDVASQSKLSKWVVKFANSSGKDLSKSVANGTAYSISQIASGTSQVYRLEVSPGSGVVNNEAISMIVYARAISSDGGYASGARDCVKAVTVKTARGNK